MRRETRLKGLFEIYYKYIEVAKGIAIIYIAYSPYSDIIYIGKTEKDLEVRKEEHFQLLRKGEHSCKAFQQLYNFVGEKNIIFKVVDRCLAGHAKGLEERYHIKYNSHSKFAVCSHNYDGKDFFKTMIKYLTNPYFETLTFEEKFIIKIYMDYYRIKSNDEGLKSCKIIEETNKDGMKLLEETSANLEFRKILDEILESVKIDEINISDSTSKYMYIKMLYDMYRDETNKLKKMIISNIYKDEKLCEDLVDLALGFGIEYETSDRNTLKSINIVIDEVFRKQYPFKPRYSDLVYYYWIEECCRYLYKQKYSW